MQDEDYTQPLFNALPPAVVVLALAMLVAELVFIVGQRGLIGGSEAIGWRVAAIQDYSFYPTLVAWVIETDNWTSGELKRFVTYSFVHWSFTHAIFVIVFLLALGKLVGEVFGNITVLVIFFACGIFGAFVYAGVIGGQQPLIGGYPSVFGLIGAYTFLLWVGYGVRGESQYRAFTLIGFLLGIRLVFGLLFGSSNDWVAELAGFALGFVLTPALAPGAFRQFVVRMRQR